MRNIPSRISFFRLLPLLLAALTACTNIDCPLDNVVALTCGIYSAEDKAATALRDTLTVKAGGVRDTVLLNKALNISSFQLPVRHGVAEDTLLFRFSNEHGQAATDSVLLRHSNEPHFESVDCPTAVFHRLTDVRWTSHALSLMPLTIDSVAIVRREVNYEDSENIQVYIRHIAK